MTNEVFLHGILYSPKLSPAPGTVPFLWELNDDSFAIPIFSAIPVVNFEDNQKSPEMTEIEEILLEKPLCDITWDGCGDGDPEVIEKMKRFICKHRSTLTDGNIDFSATPKHSTTCKIKLNTDDPQSIKAYGRSFTPDDRTLINKIVDEQKKQGIIEPSFAPY